jgi:tetratricopeptide (TPR) repeat protein
MSLKIFSCDNATRAKILNNIGVCFYQKRDFVEAMKAFTSALEIQRAWLDGKVRRDTIVFDASVTLGNMGKVYLEQENYYLSFFVNEEALLVRTQDLVCVLHTPNRLGCFF